ncbi:MAG: response regulator [Chlamydiota bacterium]
MDRGKKRILVVDDARNIRRSFCRMLELYGYQTDEAATGEEALEKVENENIALILMDVVMPGMGGIEAARKMKEKFRHRPIILMSAYDDAHAAQAGYSEGAWTFLKKPIEETELVSGLSRALNGECDSGMCGEPV